MHKVKEILINSILPKNEVFYILKHILKLDRAQLIINNELQLSKLQYESFKYLYNLRIKKVPLNYLTNECEFYSRSFKVTQDTLIPRPETEHIIDTVIEISSKNCQLVKVLDLGTGSGIIAITIKLENPNLDVMAIDKYLKTIEIAQFNAINLKANIKFLVSDWFKNINEKFDIIVSNPPYIASNDIHLQDLTYEPLDALTDHNNGLYYISYIIEKSKEFLNNNGWLIIEHGYNQARDVYEVFKKNNFSNISCVRDFADIERITYGQFNPENR